MKAQNTIAVIFDFDDTLAPDSTSRFLESEGIDAPRFWNSHRERLRAGWDPMPAYLQMMIEESNQRPAGKRINKEKLERFGSKISLYPGVPALFERLRKQARAASIEIRLEFFLISSGIGEILRATKIAQQFSDMWACDFSYNRSGEIQGLKNVVSFTDKTRFLFQITKDLFGPSAKRDPFAVNKKVVHSELHLPMDQMVIVGDGYTDIPCFSLVQKEGGIAIGVYDRKSRDRWGKAWGFVEDKRVAHLVAADYRKHSGLDDALSLALETMIRKIALRGMTYQG